MTTPDPSDFTADDLADPNVPAETLQQIAAKRKDLWPAIQKHPNSYQGLNDWISAQQDAHEAAAQSASPQTSDPLDALRDAAEKARDGATNAFASARDAIVSVSGPAAEAVADASQKIQKNFDVKALIAQPEYLPKWVHWARVLAPISALLAVIGMLLPVSRLIGSLLSSGFWGVLMLLGLLAVLTIWVFKYVIKASWADAPLAWVCEITAVLGLILAGGFTLGGSAHVGAGLVTIGSLGLLAAAHAFFYKDNANLA